MNGPMKAVIIFLAILFVAVILLWAFTLYH
jgi:hypothetical protein